LTLSLFTERKIDVSRFNVVKVSCDYVFYHKHAYKCLKDNIHISFSADKL